MIAIHDSRIIHMIAVTFYTYTVWGIAVLVLLFLLCIAWIRIEAHFQRRHLRRMMKEADEKRQRAGGNYNYESIDLDRPCGENNNHERFLP